ncbi:ABC transporter permease [Bilophila wadsworthia]|jgi:ABC-2 type transporter|uniref:ABC transporter permease n=1 Tax=Bilophila wadsworthia TaxID=35833 RepID=UPI0024329972|nr:ABC transporter permease [Bilophila wadsworthia]
MTIFQYGLADILNSFRKSDLIRMLGRQDMNLRYRRSKFGPFWITISMGIQILTLGLVFGQLFGTSIHKFLPFLAIGIILWSYLTSIVSEGCSSFIVAEGLITQLDLPIAFHFFRLVWRSFLFLIHDAVIIPLVFFVMLYPINWSCLLFIPGFLLLTINISWMGMITGIFCTRFRDFPQLIASILQIFFYVTPIMWMPELMPERASRIILDLNPFYHLISVVRDPIMGTIPSIASYLVCCIMAVTGWVIATLLLGRYRDRIAYWL